VTKRPPYIHRRRRRRRRSACLDYDDGMTWHEEEVKTREYLCIKGNGLTLNAQTEGRRVDVKCSASRGDSEAPSGRHLVFRKLLGENVDAFRLVNVLDGSDGAVDLVYAWVKPIMPLV